MADPPRYVETGGPDRRSGAGAPRWVKVFGLIALVVVLLFVVLLLIRGPGGGHGPAQHTSSGVAGGWSALVSVSGPGVGGTYARPDGAH